MTGRIRTAFFRVRRSGTLLFLALLIALAMPLAGALGTAPPPEGAAFCIAPEALPGADAAALRRGRGLPTVTLLGTVAAMAALL